MGTIKSLVVAHSGVDGEGGFRLETCQRVVWVSASPVIVDAEERFLGEAAYRFLLSLLCGLESEIQGETQIFGQFKDAWKKFAERHPENSLRSIVQNLFEDAKQIRTDHLRDIGGNSYGSLARRVLKERSIHAEGPNLLVGAGQLAEEILPWLTDGEVWILNRTPERARSLAEKLGVRARIVNPDQALEAYSRSRNWIFCIPLDPQEDGARSALWSDKPVAERGCVMHLGGQLRVVNAWAGVESFYGLDELFRLQRQQDGIKSARLAQAKRACGERAKLRALGGSITTAHGWEDLAVFS